MGMSSRQVSVPSFFLLSENGGASSFPHVPLIETNYIIRQCSDERMFLNTLNTGESLWAARFLWERVGEDLERDEANFSNFIYLLKPGILGRGTWTATDCGWESPWHLPQSYRWRCLRSKSYKQGALRASWGCLSWGQKNEKWGRRDGREGVLIIAPGTSSCRALYLVSILHIEFHLNISVDWNVPSFVKNNNNNSEINTPEEGVILRHGGA